MKSRSLLPLICLSILFQAQLARAQQSDPTTAELRLLRSTNERLAKENEALRAEVAAFATDHPVLAECGGLLFLLDELDGHAMCGVVQGRGRMAGRLTLGYREATALTGTPWLDPGMSVRGHEFHYSSVQLDDADPAWRLRSGGVQRDEGCVRGGVQASYLHTHWAARPEIPRRLARAALPVAA